MLPCKQVIGLHDNTKGQIGGCLFLLAVETTCFVQKHPVDKDKELYKELLESKAMTTDELRAWLSSREDTGQPVSAGAEQINADCSHDMKAWMASLRNKSISEEAQGTGSNADVSEGAGDGVGALEADFRHESQPLSEKQWSAKFSHAAKTEFIWQGMAEDRGSVEMQEEWNRKLMGELKNNPRFMLDPFLPETAEKDTACSSQVTFFCFIRPAPQNSITMAVVLYEERDLLVNVTSSSIPAV
jgi:hypothetical protein